MVRVEKFRCFNNQNYRPQRSRQKCVDTDFGQHTRALERASRKGTEEQQGHTDRLDRLSKPVRPVSRVSLESFVSRDKYHTYVVKSSKVYEQTSKG